MKNLENLQRKMVLKGGHASVRFDFTLLVAGKCMAGAVVQAEMVVADGMPTQKPPPSAG